VSPLLKSRIDANFWKMALEECENFSVLIHGGLRRRSGTKFVAEVNDSDQIARLLPFSFFNTQSYVIAVSGAGFQQFYAERGVLGAPYTVAHSWSAADIDDLTYTQFNDVAYLAHKDYAPQKLSRVADTTWTLANAVYRAAPLGTAGRLMAMAVAHHRFNYIHPVLDGNRRRSACIGQTQRGGRVRFPAKVLHCRFPALVR
jgi:hypothetical protein